MEANARWSETIVANSGSERIHAYHGSAPKANRLIAAKAPAATAVRIVARQSAVVANAITAKKPNCGLYDSNSPSRIAPRNGRECASRMPPISKAAVKNTFWP